MHRAQAAGALIALPEERSPHKTLEFRGWGTPPRAAHRRTVVPDIVIAPLLGFDRACFRLGRGDGRYDRLLAAAAPRPFVIGVGPPGAELGTIFPQPHDMPMDVLLTGAAQPIRRNEERRS